MQSLAALSDPTRRRIVELLAERERSAGELVDAFDMSAPAISQHLKVLREAGLVLSRAEGQSRIQSLNPAGFRELEVWLEKTRSVWSARLDALERELLADDARQNAAPSTATTPAPRLKARSSVRSVSGTSSKSVSPTQPQPKPKST